MQTEGGDFHASKEKSKEKNSFKSKEKKVNWLT